jgi:ATP-binding cassette subfamily B protein
MTDLAIEQEAREELATGIDVGLWRKIFSLAMGHKAALYSLIGTVVVLAACDGSLTLVSMYLVDDLKAHGAEARWWRWAWMYAGLCAVFCACIGAFIVFAGKLTTHVSYDIRRAGFARLQELSFSYYDKRPAGWLMARLTSDCNKLSRILSFGTLDVVWGSCFLAALSIIMFTVDWRLALVVLAVAPFVGWVSVVFQRRILTASRRVRKANSDITASFNESISGVRTTKTLVRERENLGEFEHLTGGMYAAAVRNALYSAMYLPIVITFGSLATALALWYGGGRVMADYPPGHPLNLTLGQMWLFMNCSMQMVFPVQELAFRFAEIQAARAAAERVVELLETEPEIQDSPEVRRRIEASRRNRAPGATGERDRPGRYEGEQAEDGYPARIERMEFRGVTYWYKEGEPVLEDFDLAVEAGQTVALVGPTGGGKSTIVSLLSRFYEPRVGEILINGVDYRLRGLHWLQSNLGIVLQQPHLFSGTVRENIAYGKLDATDDEIARAAELVDAAGFIEALEHGYDTQVGEGGGSLSTGQKQLISFARAVLADPQIFVMDEATASVDTETEQVIQRSIAQVLAGRISFVIAHRLSTIRAADRILVIDGGRIVEQGDHAGLLAQRGRYYELYTHQFARERQEQALEGE